MAKIEKIGNIQVIDNKEDKFFCFPMISMALYQVWVQEILTILIVRIFSFIERTNPLIV